MKNSIKKDAILNKAYKKSIDDAVKKQMSAKIHEVATEMCENLNNKLLAIIKDEIKKSIERNTRKLAAKFASRIAKDAYIELW